MTKLSSVYLAQRIQNVAFLAKESIEFVNTLALRIEYWVYSPKDWIIEKLPDGMYFVLRGSVQLDGPSHPQIFYRENAEQRLNDMRSMHARHDQQEQKMKRMLGRSADNDMANNPIASTGRHSVSYGGDTRSVMKQKIPWRMPGSSFRKWWEHARLFSLVFVVFEVPLYCVFDADTFPFGHKSVYSLQSMTSILVELYFVADFIFQARFFAFVDQVALITVSDASYILEAYREKGILTSPGFIVESATSRDDAAMAYLRSIYWAIVALTTVGYGDIVAFSTYESYFAAVWVFVGAIINYGVVGAMSNIISNLTASSRHHSEKMNTVNVTLGHFRISESVRARIRQFYHQQFTTVIAATVLDASVITHSTFVSKIERYFPAEMEALRTQATQQHIFDMLTLEAVIDNIKSRSTLAKFTEQCTSHLAACIFYLICHTDHNPKNWTHHDPIVHMEHESTGVLYLRAFYWALTTVHFGII
eukprot:jgi/Phyca11/21228/fgenesh1_pg.PHYCAscaffold_86_\